MKKRAIVFFALIISILFVSFSLALFVYRGESIKKNYLGGERISGKINISFGNESAYSLFTSNFKGNISLVELLDENGFLSGVDYNCTSPDCNPKYVIKNEIDHINLDGDKVIGMKISGFPITEISSVKFKITSNAGKSCNEQLKVGILERENKITNNKYINEDCSVKEYGCFNLGLSPERYSNFVIIKNEYCQEMNLPLAPAYRLGSWIKNSTNGKSDRLLMKMYDSEDSFLGECELPEHTKNEEELGCVVNYSSTSENRYRVCISNEDYIDAISSGNYLIRTENNAPVCGTDDFGQTNKRDYEIFARPMKFDNFNIEVDDEIYTNYFGNSLKSDFMNYIDDRYFAECTPYCVLPIFLSGSNQTVSISGIQIIYKIGGSQPSPETKAYRIEEESPRISSGILGLELESADFVIPVESKENKFELSLDGRKIASIPINITPSFNFDIFPKFSFIGIENEFAISSNLNISSAKWDFGDGTKINTSGRQARHRYLEQGEYEASVEVISASGTKATKSFEIIVGNPKDSANLLYNRSEIRLRNITLKADAFPSWVSIKIKKEVEKHGGKNVGSISAKTGFILAGENMGPEKLKKAEKLGIPILSEDDFIKMIGGGKEDKSQGQMALF